MFRIRILNRAGGHIEVSADKGINYHRVGMVTKAAITTAQGFLAAKYTDNGTIAATAVHGLRIKTGGTTSGTRYENRIISILPSEFHVEPAKFGGHAARSSGIMTNISAGTSIFRNLAPFTGNQVCLEKSGLLTKLPHDYTPQVNDRFVIIVTLPDKLPNEIVFENRKDGIVEAHYGNRKEIIAVVKQPVTGVGRFDATGYTGIGAINTNHPGVITISTAPLNGGEFGSSKQETRGGFQIVPFKHALTLGISAQLMVVAPVEKGKELEGTPPLFNSCIGLASDSINAQTSYYADMKTETSDWEPFPALVGKKDNALSKNSVGAVKHMAYLRIHFPSYKHEWILSQIQKSTTDYMNNSRIAANKQKSIIQSNLVSLSMDGTYRNNTEYVNLYLDGVFRGVSNQAPYGFIFNASDFSPGEHYMEMNAIDANGRVILSKNSTFYIN
ncbi:MAG: hypothetical protein ACYC0V_08700 [Armatimonadota bacterium]